MGKIRPPQQSGRNHLPQQEDYSSHLPSRIINNNLPEFEITSFRQEDDEAMHEAWEQYRDLFRRCPMHGLPEWTQVSNFYNSVNTPTWMMLDASANGTLLDKPPREGLEILEKLAQNDCQHPTTRRGIMRRGTAQLDSSDTILSQISALTN
ncbi:hypothetical protein V6N13_001984 [Hibiscus sabdariffa]